MKKYLFYFTNWGFFFFEYCMHQINFFHCKGLNTSGTRNGGTVDLSTLLDGGAELVDLEDEDEDQDWREDPIYAIDLKKYLFTFLRYRVTS